MPKKSFANIIAEWERLLAALLANAEDLRYLDPFRSQLEAELAGAKAASIRQSSLQAEVQQSTRDLEGFLARGADLATRLRTGIRSKYGLRSEKLTEFGLRPFRKRKAKEAPAEVKPAPTATTTE